MAIYVSSIKISLFSSQVHIVYGFYLFTGSYCLVLGILQILVLCGCREGKGCPPVCKLTL